MPWPSWPGQSLLQQAELPRCLSDHRIIAKNSDTDQVVRRCMKICKPLLVLRKGVVQFLPQPSKTNRTCPPSSDQLGQLGSVFRLQDYHAENRRCVQCPARIMNRNRAEEARIAAPDLASKEGRNICGLPSAESFQDDHRNALCHLTLHHSLQHTDPWALLGPRTPATPYPVPSVGS